MMKNRKKQKKFNILTKIHKLTIKLLFQNNNKHKLKHYKNKLKLKMFKKIKAHKL